MTLFRMDEDIEIDNAMDTSINLPLIWAICLSSLFQGVNCLDHGLLIQTMTANGKYVLITIANVLGLVVKSLKYLHQNSRMILHVKEWRNEHPCTKDNKNLNFSNQRQ